MAQMVYGYKDKARFPVSPQVAGEEITRIRAEHAGFFTPGALVVASMPSDAPLHSVFEWDDSAAAVAYRNDQAKALIRSVVVVNSNDPATEPVRAFVSVIPPDQDRPSYTTIAAAMSDADLREQVLGQALADIRAFERKYSRFLDLSGVVAAFESARIRAAAPPARLAS
jgi:hypothetical protein